VTSSDRRIAAGLFVLTFVTYAWFFNGGGWNQNSYLDLVRSIVERRAVNIDPYHGNTGDVSWSRSSGDWHVYINKPPGVAFVGAVPYAFLYAIERVAKIPPGSWEVLTVNAWLITVFTCGVTGALIPVLLFIHGRRKAGASPLGALGVALAVAFGTIVFPYSTMLFAHVPAAMFLLLALVLLDERPLLAGVAAGIAGACYYVSIPVALILLIGAWVRNGPRAALRFGLGGIPFGILLLLYQFLNFGSPFVTATEVSTGFVEKGLLFGVLRLPTLDALWGLTFDDYRGLFFISPVLLLAFVGMFRMTRRDLALLLPIVVFYFVAIASFNQWHGGWAFGPRYILPVVPLLAIPMLSLRGRVLGLVGIGLGIFSFGVHLVATAVTPMPPTAIRRPVQEYLVPRFLAGHTSVNEQSVDERRPHERYARGSYESTWASFNLGELLTGPYNSASVLPIALWVVFGSAMLARACEPKLKIEN